MVRQLNGPYSPLQPAEDQLVTLERHLRAASMAPPRRRPTDPPTEAGGESWVSQRGAHSTQDRGRQLLHGDSDAAVVDTERKPTQAVPAIDLVASSGLPEPASAAKQSWPAVVLGILAQLLTLLYHQLSFLHNTGLFWLITTFGTPTNQIMLAYRTVAQDLKEQPCNDDRLAALLRDALMPRRGWVHRTMPFVLHAYRWFLESPLFGCPGIITFVDARTRWFDEEVAAATQQPGGCTQVVIVAAGYCTRPYRLLADKHAGHAKRSSRAGKTDSSSLDDRHESHESGVHFFEVDLPGASLAKQHLVRKLGLQSPGLTATEYVAADLSTVSLEVALKATGFDPKARTLFTCEGLLYYLPAEAVEQLLSSIARLAAPGSRVVFDFIEQDVMSLQRLSCGYHSLRLTVQNKGEQLKSGLSPCPYAMTQLLGRCGGLHLRKLVTPRSLAERMMPGRTWSPLAPPLPDFFHYCVAEKW